MDRNGDFPDRIDDPAERRGTAGQFAEDIGTQIKSGHAGVHGSGLFPCTGVPVSDEKIRNVLGGNRRISVCGCCPLFVADRLDSGFPAAEALCMVL